MISAVVAACAVSFTVASLLLKTDKQNSETVSLEDATSQMKSMKMGSGKTELSGSDYSNLKTIYVSCDAGMGSSAMGASMLRKKVQAAGLDIRVVNCAINDLPLDARLVVTHKDLTLRAKQQAPEATHLSLTNFLDNPFYDSLVSDIVDKLGAVKHGVEESPEVVEQPSAFKLQKEQIFLGLKAATKEEAIRFAGEQLVKAGFAKPDYVPAMFEREKLVSTYLGEGVAVPHGTIEAKDEVIKTGIVFCQYPDGVQFTDEEDGVAKLVIGIAAKNNEHIAVVTSITSALDSEESIEVLTTTSDVEQVLKLLK